MAKKLLNGVLILILIVTWVFVGKKVFYMVGNKGTEKINYSSSVSTAENPVFSKDTFNLIHIQRDPFLGSISKGKKKVSLNQNKVHKIINTDITNKNLNSVITWPKLKYFGYMKGGGSQQKLVLIKINNKLHRLRAKEEIEEIYVSSVYADSVILKKGKEYKTIFK